MLVNIFKHIYLCGIRLEDARKWVLRMQPIQGKSQHCQWVSSCTSSWSTQEIHLLLWKGNVLSLFRYCLYTASFQVLLCFDAVNWVNRKVYSILKSWPNNYQSFLLEIFGGMVWNGSKKCAIKKQKAALAVIYWVSSLASLGYICMSEKWFVERHLNTGKMQNRQKVVLNFVIFYETSGPVNEI